MRGICLISAANINAGDLEELFCRCGFAVWTPTTVDDAQMYRAALCLVIDMPGIAGQKTLELFRAYGVQTPALLIVDPDCEMTASELNISNVMDVVPRGTNPLRILRWVQSLLAASSVLETSYRRRA